ncbi:MAG TPA: hypothetical protein VLJ11_05660 [Bryobacteraceae bacterium]|nr:hypothetical protein [Bryobacteraceae bacterium]
MEPGASEADEGAEGLNGFAVTRSEAAELLQAAEAAFDAVAALV